LPAKKEEEEASSIMIGLHCKREEKENDLESFFLSFSLRQVAGMNEWTAIQLLKI